MKAARITAHLAGAGLFAGAAAWAVHQQIEYVVASLVCRKDATALMWIVSAAAFAILIVGAVLSWLAARSFAGEEQAGLEDTRRARHFLAKVAVMGALIFFFAIFLQAAALLYLPVCTG